MTTFNYPLATATWDNKEIEAMHRVIASGNFTMGAEVASYEEAFAKYFSSQHAVMSNSGSSANLLALGAIRYSSRNSLPARDEVIVPAVSWSTTYYPITQMGFKLVFVDVDLETLNSPLELIEAAVTPKTAGVVVVNLLGNPSDLEGIREFCSGRDLFMVEDNCESLGAEVNGRFTGTFGDVGTFSSFFSHHISTMEGGTSVTDDVELSQVMRSLRAHGWTRDLPTQNAVFSKTGNDFEDSFRFVLPGFNLRPLELEGALGTEQLIKVPEIIRGRRDNHRGFLEVMKNYPELLTQKEHGKSSWFGFSIVLTGSLSGKRDELVSSFNQYGIACRPIVAGNFTRNPVLQHLPHLPFGQLPAADKVHDDGLFIGNHHYLMSREFEVLESALQKFSKYA